MLFISHSSQGDSTKRSCELSQFSFSEAGQAPLTSPKGGTDVAEPETFPAAGSLTSLVPPTESQSALNARLHESQPASPLLPRFCDGKKRAEATALHVNRVKVKLRKLQNAAGADKASKFSGMPFEHLLFVEVFAGTARLTQAVKTKGFQVVAVDHDPCRSEGTHIAAFDISTEHDTGSLLEYLEANKDRLVWVHFAPPCGTASQARSKPLATFEARGLPVPKSLRSCQPCGVDGLDGADKIRAETANQIYANTTLLRRALIQWQVLCSIENPETCLFWLVPEVRQLLAEVGGYKCIFDNCSRGGQRKKSTCWWASEPVFMELALTCDGSHPHAAWVPRVVDGYLVFPTQQEAAYPQLLCERLASILA